MASKSWYKINASANGAEILIYDEIGMWGVTAKDFAQDLKALKGLGDIALRINSPGGSVFEGIAIYNLIKNHGGTIVAHVDGLAASMASVIAMAATKVVMPENALMMVHNPWGGAVGDAAELRKAAETMDKVKEAMISAYAAKTGKSAEEISAIMDEETWYTGADAVREGFADELGQAVQMAASFDLSKFSNVPQTLSAVAGNVQKPVKQENPMTDKTQATVNPVDVEAVKAAAAAEAIKAEESRRSGIVAAFGGFSKQHGELLNKCLLDGKVSVADAQAALLKKLGEGETPVATGSVQVQDTGASAKLKAMADVVAMRAGLKADGDVGQNPFRGHTLLDIARASLETRNVNLSGMDKMQIVAAAFTHSSGDFSSILSNTANKSMLKGYQEVEEVFSQFTSVGSLPDFKAATRVDINEAPSLRQVREGAEYKSITMGDRGETVQLATYGELFSITRQAIINDDLSVFTRIPQKMGRAARRTIGDLVFSILTGNPTMSDGKTLFHADHNNLLTPGGLTVAAFGAGRAAMAKQKSRDGRATLNVRPSILLVPVGLEADATVLMNSEFDPAKTQRVPNSARNAATVIADARLDEASASAWYLLASPSMFDVIEVQYLDGNPNPMLEQQAGWNVDGVEFKVRIDAGAKALDYVTLQKNS